MASFSWQIVVCFVMSLFIIEHVNTYSVSSSKLMLKRWLTDHANELRAARGAPFGRGGGRGRGHGRGENEATDKSEERKEDDNVMYDTSNVVTEAAVEPDTPAAIGPTHAVAAETCSDGLFTCDNGKCAMPTWRCDGDNDCGDGSDEVHCHGTCYPDQFRCQNGKCIRQSYVCDRDDDCGDLSDEKSCGHTCPDNKFTCPSGRCINLHWVCDGGNDCGDRADEQNCGGTRPPLPPLPGMCPPEFSTLPIESGVRSCYRPVTTALQWQSAADYCRAKNPRAHLLVVETQAEYNGLVSVFANMPASFAASCPYWWTAGRRADDTSIHSLYVWKTFSDSCGEDGCSSEFQVSQFWPSREAVAVPEGQSACVMFSIKESTIPWIGASCATQACTVCELDMQ